MGLSIQQCIRLHTSGAHVLCVYVYTLYTLYNVYAPLSGTRDTADGTRHAHTHTHTSPRGHTRERKHVTLGQSLSRHVATSHKASQSGQRGACE